MPKKREDLFATACLGGVVICLVSALAIGVWGEEAAIVIPLLVPSFFAVLWRRVEAIGPGGRDAHDA